ncbi:RH39 [Symbiodinium sp. CCMP2456]|nr:RH39 [Symbiodinium sp. CCMP2456]
MPASSVLCSHPSGHRTGPARGPRTLCRAKGSRALTVMEEVEEWKNRPMEATVLQEGLEMERRFGRPYFDEKRGIGKVCDWLPHRGFGYLLCGSPPEKIIFRASDVPKDYLASKGGKVPMEADVEFNLAGTWRGRKRAKDLVFPMAGTFAELGLKPEVIEGAANSLGLDPRENPEAPALLNPAPVQQEAIPYILNGDNIVIAAETGSGKSLAYMLPMVQIIRGMAQARNMDYGLAYRAGCPLALAICPTRELAIQAYRTLKLISHHAKCRVRLVHGGSMTWRKQRQEISQVVDILVCTPDRRQPAHEPYHGGADFVQAVVESFGEPVLNSSLREVIYAVRSHLARAANPSVAERSSDGRLQDMRRRHAQVMQRLPAAGRTAAPPSAAKGTGLFTAEQAQAALPVPTNPPASEDEEEGYDFGIEEVVQPEFELERLRKELETVRATASAETLAAARKELLKERQRWEAERAELQRSLEEAERKSDSKDAEGTAQLDLLSAGQWLAQLLPPPAESRKSPEVSLDLAGAWTPLAQQLPQRERGCVHSLHFGVFFGDDRQTPLKLSSARLCPEALSWAPSTSSEASVAGSSIDRPALQADLCSAHERFLADVFLPWAKTQETSERRSVAWLLCNDGEAFTLGQAMLAFGKALGSDERWRATVLVVDRAKSNESEPAVEALALAEGETQKGMKQERPDFGRIRLLKFYNSKDIRLEEIAYVAIDEADFLLTQGFDDLYKILDLVDQDSRPWRDAISKPAWAVIELTPSAGTSVRCATP